MHGHVAGAHTAAHPQTCEKCDKECYSKNSLQKREVNVNDQLVVSGSLCWKLESLSMRSPTPILARSVTKSFTVRMVCRDICL